LHEIAPGGEQVKTSEVAKVIARITDNTADTVGRTLSRKKDELSRYLRGQDKGGFLWGLPMEDQDRNTRAIINEIRANGASGFDLGQNRDSPGTGENIPV